MRSSERSLFRNTNYDYVGESSNQAERRKKTGRKRRKLHVFEGDDFEEDPDYVMYLKTVIEDKEGEDDDANDDEDTIEEEEEEEKDEDDDRNEGFHVDIDREMEMDGNGIDVGDDLDPEYKMFLANLREDGKSYVLEMTGGKGNSVFVKYEEPLPVHHERKRGFATKKIRKEGPLNDSLKEMPSTSLPPRPSKGKSTPINDSHHMPPPPKIIKRNSTPINDCHLTKEYSKRKSKLINDSHPFLDEFKLASTSTVDESYYMFLKSVRVRGKAMFLMTDDMILEYGEENMVTPSVPQKSPKYGDPYSKELEFGLRKPQKCHELHQVERTREMRKRSVNYETDEIGRSYLDHHPDLEKMVRRAKARRDVCREMLLLRCLFFSNENVAQEGSFFPWKNPSFVSQILGPVGTDFIYNIVPFFFS
ncbi:hypothetical protein MKX01_018718 [Papaver californicum]|nr:hypothetical protein MKX01_018718 [Papaver californicum]